MRTLLIWAGLALALFVPLALAAQSPLLQWRGPMYIAGGFAGIIGLGLMLLQALLAGRLLPAIAPRTALGLHRWGGVCLVLCVVLHVAGLWITSPPDVVDVLLFRSPTPFGVWGALAMWAVFAAGALALLRDRMRPRHWRRLHGSATGVALVGTALHALLIEGAMEMWSKALLCLAAVIAATLAYRVRRTFRLR